MIAIDASVDIGHHETIGVLNDLLAHSPNDDITEAVYEALAMLDELF